MRKLTLLVFAVIISLIATFGPVDPIRAADTWTFLGHSKLAFFYYDSENITRPFEGIVRVLIKQSPRNPSASEGSIVTLCEFDCRKRTFCVVRRTVYDAQGTIIFETNHRERQEPIRRDTIPKKLHGLICGINE